MRRRPAKRRRPQPQKQPRQLPQPHSHRLNNLLWRRRGIVDVGCHAPHPFSPLTGGGGLNRFIAVTIPSLTHTPIASTAAFNAASSFGFCSLVNAVST